jgi:hypothetical protein
MLTGDDKLSSTAGRMMKVPREGPCSNRNLRGSGTSPRILMVAPSFAVPTAFSAVGRRLARGKPMAFANSSEIAVRHSLPESTRASQRTPF